MLKLIKGDPLEIYESAIKYHKENFGEILLPIDEASQIYATVSALLGDILYTANNIAIENYLPFAKDTRLDMKGLIYGSRGKRLSSSFSKAIIQCRISQIVDRNVFIKKGTRFTNGTHIFFSTEETIIPAGETQINILVQAEEPGDLGDILPGEINKIIDRYDYYESSSNLEKVIPGLNKEPDPQYRKRLEELPESFPTAGSGGSYKYWVKHANPLVNQIYIKSPTPNNINIYVYGEENLISLEDKKAIENYLQDLDRLPLNDLVQVLDPEIISLNLEIDFYLYPSEIRSIETIKLLLKEKIKKHFKIIKIGEDINIQDLIAIIKNEGIKKCDIKMAELSIKDITLVKCGDIVLSYRGV